MNAMPETAAERAYEGRALLCLAAVSAFVRVGYTAVIDMHDAGNASWMQPIGGLVLCLPALWGMLRMLPAAKDPNPVPPPAWLRVLALLAFLINFTMDGSVWLFSLAESAAYVTFSEAPFMLLYLPALVAAAVSASKGGNACGGLARLMLYTLPALVAVSLIVQARQMRPVWITPILGGGVRALLRGAFACAGAAISFPAGAWALLCAEPRPADAETRALAKRGLPLCALAASAFAALYALLAPNIPYAPTTREFALDRLLSGGGTGTSVQFPLLICWYSLLFLCSVFDLYAAARCLKALFAKLSLRLCAWLCALGSGAWTLAGFSLSAMAVRVSFARYAVISAFLLLLPTAAFIQRRRKTHAGG